MATSVQRFSATVNAGTPQASPAVTSLAVIPGQIDLIRWRVPPGPRGTFGWQLTMGGVQVIPENAGVFIVADNEYDDIQVSGLPDSGAWQVTGYNTGANNHTVYLDFHVTPQGAVQAQQGDLTTGFPMSDADVPGMWLT
jgi:hypothetical protein